MRAERETKSDGEIEHKEESMETSSPLGSLHPKARRHGHEHEHGVPCSTCSYREVKMIRVTRITQKPLANL